MRSIQYFIVLCALAFATTATALAQVTSRYTSISDRVCKQVESGDDEGTSYQGECLGVGGYKLKLLEGDLRQSVDIVSPGGKAHPLEFWNISNAFSYLGQRVEWRMKGKAPIALIARFNVSENPGDASKVTSYLVVAKITKTEVCVTNVIRPGRSQNVDARKAADSSSDRPCRQAGTP